MNFPRSHFDIGQNHKKNAMNINMNIKWTLKMEFNLCENRFG